MRNSRVMVYVEGRRVQRRREKSDRYIQKGVKRLFKGRNVIEAPKHRDIATRQLQLGPHLPAVQANHLHRSTDPPTPPRHPHCS